MKEQLKHSAKGTTWSKKNHRYIRKEGNRYIYVGKDGNGSGDVSRNDVSTGNYTKEGAITMAPDGYHLSNGERVRDMDIVLPNGEHYQRDYHWDSLFNGKQRTTYGSGPRAAIRDDIEVNQFTEIGIDAVSNVLDWLRNRR